MFEVRWWMSRFLGSSIVFMLVILLALPLFAQEGSKAPDVAGALKERAQAFWEAKVKEDYAAQYRFLEPKVRRKMSLTDYIKRQGPVQYLEAHVDGAKVEEARGFVTVRILFQLKLPPKKTPVKQEKVFQEEWVRRGGEWYRLYPQG
ncbi:MAG: hypothetical protein ACK4Z6_03370 [Candidatus Methylomirabilales bacterium]